MGFEHQMFLHFYVFNSVIVLRLNFAAKPWNSVGNGGDERLCNG